MAIALNAGEIGRSDLFAIFPEHIIVNHLDNSRSTRHSQAEIEALAESIRADGQLQACVARRIEDNKVQLVSGYGRWGAIAYLNEKYPDEKRKLQCKIMDLNAEEAFVCSIRENFDRTTPTAVDDAYAQRRLRESFGWSEERIAEFYKKSVSHVNQRRTLLKLNRSIQKEVANGTMSVGAAQDVAKLPEAEREAVVAEAKDPETGKVNSTTIREKVREKAIESGEARSRTMKEVKAFFEDLNGELKNAGAVMIAARIVEYIKGSITDKQMVNSLVKHCKED